MANPDLTNEPKESVAFSNSALARTLRHEMGDFLQKVYASVAILQNRLSPAADLEREVLVRLQKRAEECRFLIDQLQDFLCPARLNIESVDLTAIVRSVVEKVSRSFPPREIRIECGAASNVKGDPQRLAQVASILVMNACEFSKRRVDVSVANTENQLTWVVADDGPGVADEVREELFVPFRSSRPGHAGVGLALARKLVLLHGGRIEVAKAALGGLKITVSLPAG